jgi:hypothetical protein
MKIEIWDTRYGVSVRVVARKRDGKFINNKSDRQVVDVILALDDAGLFRPKVTKVKTPKVDLVKKPKVNLRKD